MLKILYKSNIEKHPIYSQVIITRLVIAPKWNLNYKFSTYNKSIFIFKLKLYRILQPVFLILYAHTAFLLLVPIKTSSTLPLKYLGFAIQSGTYRVIKSKFMGKFTYFGINRIKILLVKSKLYFLLHFEIE